jgi:uncharacterized membrane protein
VSVHRGGTASLSFRLVNHTAATVGRSTATVSAPASLHLKGPQSVRIASLKAGQSRAVRLALKVGPQADLGRGTVKVKLKLGDRTATSRVTIVVLR